MNQSHLLSILLTEIRGHEYEKTVATTRCVHSSHGYIPARECWKAEANKFLKSQGCNQHIGMAVNGVIEDVMCCKVHNHNDAEHEGWVSDPDSPFLARRIIWTIAPAMRV